MPSLYALKPGFQAVLRPAVRSLARAHVTPNAVTLGSLAMCAGYGALMAVTASRTAFMLLPAVLLLRMALNAVDGMLAREHDRTSILGARLNEFADVVSDLCLYLPFMVLAPAGPVVLAVLTGILAEFAGILCCAHGGARSYQGPFGKSDRAAFFAAVAVTLSLLSPPDILVAASFLLAAAAGAVTAVNRLMQGARS
jgi:CDP-diacylglycerol---glycerol-3-phosphate 3-phosphatidyltransferase